MISLNKENLRYVIQQDFLSRCKNNPTFSIRSFAKILGVDQSYLTKIMNGKKSLSKKSSLKIIERLELKATHLNQILKEDGDSNLNLKSQMLDHYEVSSNWIYLAIIEFLKSNSPQVSAQNIACHLGLHNEQVKDALNRLKRLGFISWIDDQIELKKPYPQDTQESQYRANKQLKVKLLEKNIDTLNILSPELYEFHCLTTAISKEDLSGFKEIIKKANSDLKNLIKNSGKTSQMEIYQIIISLFPLSKTKDL